MEDMKLEKRVSMRTIENAYIGETDWEVRENANTNLSFSNFMGFIFDKLLKNPPVLSEFLPGEAVRSHFEGFIHIHKLPHSLWIPYCAGWSYERILKYGLKTPNIISRPARHLDTAVAHLANFFFMGAQEWTGAQAVSAFDLYVAPFVRSDKLDYKRTKQILQGLLFELNYPARSGYQSPFTNITLVLDTSNEMLSGNAYVGGEVVGSLSDFIDEAILVNKALFELYLEGDALGQPFTFPIPTIMLTKNFDWNGRKWGDLTDKIFEALAKRGTAYLLNGYASNVESLYAMCCRLTIDMNHILNFNNNFTLKFSRVTPDDAFEAFLRGRRGRTVHGMWAIPDATGSIGVITINLPRLAMLSKGEWSIFEELLEGYLKIARNVLLTWRRRYERSLKAGLMPITKVYLGHFKNHYNTLGLIGLPEASANFMRNPKVWFEGSGKEICEAVEIERRMVSLVRRYAQEFEEDDGYLYNVEEIPGESTGYSFARSDLAMFKDEYENGEILIPNDGMAPFYSNSIVPYYADIPIYQRALWEGEVQQEFTGGVMMHLFLAEQPDAKALKNLVYRIATNTKVVYFSITPTVAVCRKCGWNSIGVYDECPKCGGEVDLWSRIVGYYRPIRNWNPGKRAEFRLRQHYKL
ncbi:MAG: anaerobic ribonucleoside-triphosphate reductase [Thermoprotei archaeon]|nr:MAG: anaerobic ribonucleoside-triphosphate reductase [Thermoprotei archaeon]RLF02621.1 MAG: anaerobic ribonucleoside-triphosphate reductase [Thermoprotei archaeon]